MGSPAILVRLRVPGALRPGSPDGSRSEVDRVLHSDTLYSALTCAFEQLGSAAEWVAATAESASPEVRLGSAFPFVGRTLLLPAPKNAWPPAGSGKVRWKAARFIPAAVAGAVLRGEAPNEDRWAVDPVSECLLPVERNGVITEPFRVARRSGAAVDRITGLSSVVFTSACLEFNQGAGLWCVVTFADSAARDKWSKPIESAFRLLGDSGVGGERSSGWGRFESPEFEHVQFPEFLGLPKPAEEEAGHWLFSLYSPADSDNADWQRGAYALAVRSGWSQRGEKKRAAKLVVEGSVVAAGESVVGRSWNVAVEGSERPLYRWGVGLSVPVTLKVVARPTPVRDVSVVPPELSAALEELSEVEASLALPEQEPVADEPEIVTAEPEQEEPQIEEPETKGVEE